MLAASRLPKWHHISQSPGAAAATSNVFTTVGDWWEDVRPGWIFPKQKRLPPGEQQQQSVLTTIAPLSLTGGQQQQQPGPSIVPATNLQLPKSLLD